MSSFIHMAVVALLIASGLARAQAPGAPAAKAAPAASAASGSALTYRSAFEGYRPFKEQPVAPWRESNDLVGRIGGWQAYAREGQGAPAAEAPSQPAAGHADMHAAPTPPAGAAPSISPAASTPGPSPAPVKAPPAATHSDHKKP